MQTGNADTGRAGVPETVGAAVIIIGDEILSGRTQDVNLQMIAGVLGEVGIEIREARVISDTPAQIVDAVNTMRAAHAYVFTTGGIGPTHDDITADCVAQAFGVELHEHPDAVRLLDAHYPPGEFTEARRRMTRVPVGASLISNPVSIAPGFQMENVFVLAGIPVVAKAMMEGLVDRLVGGARLLSRTIRCTLAESQIAGALTRVQDAYPDVRIGSYPVYRGGHTWVIVVIRSTDRELLDSAAGEVKEAIRARGVEPDELAGD